MPRTGLPSPLEFREQLDALHRTGRSVEELARELIPRNNRPERDRAVHAGRCHGNTRGVCEVNTAEYDELPRHRTEVRHQLCARGERCGAWAATCSRPLE